MTVFKERLEKKRLWNIKFIRYHHINLEPRRIPLSS